MSVNIHSVKPDFVHPALEQGRFADYSLGVMLSQSLIAYAFYSPKGEVHLLKHYYNELGKPFVEFLDNTFQRDELLKMPKTNLQQRVGILADRWMMLPNEFAVKGAELDYLGSMFSVTASDLPYKDIVRSHGIAILYCLDDVLAARINGYFPGATLLHSVTAGIEFHMELARNRPAGHLAQCGIHMFQNQMILLVSRQEQVAFCNLYTTKSASDILYFVAGVTQISGLRPEDCELYFAGHSSLRQSAEVMLNDNFPNVFDPDEFLTQDSEAQLNNFSASDFPFLLASTATASLA